MRRTQADSIAQAYPVSCYYKLCTIQIRKNTNHYCFMFSTLHYPGQQHNSVLTVDFYLK